MQKYKSKFKFLQNQTGASLMLAVLTTAFVSGAVATSATVLTLNWSDWNLTQHTKEALTLLDVSDSVLGLKHDISLPFVMLETRRQNIALEKVGIVAGTQILNHEAGIMKQETETKIITQEVSKVINEINNYTVSASLTEQELVDLVSKSETLKNMLKGPKGDKGDQGSGSPVLYTLPTSTNTNSMGSIGGFSHLSGNDLTTQNITVTNNATFSNITVSGCTGCSASWNSIANPAGSLSLTMAANTTTFTYNATTGASNLFNLTDTNSNTGTGYLLNLTTGTSSTLKPLHISAAGVEALTILANGNVGVGTINPQRQFVVDSAAGPIIGLYTSGTERALLRADTSGNFIIDANGGEKVRVTSTGSLQFNQNSIISRGTSDGSDNGVLELSGGGATGTSRGGSLLVYGNEHATLPGYARVQLGNGTSHFQVMDNDSTTALLDVDRGTGNLTVAPGTGGAFVLGGTSAGLIRKNTSDGSDNGQILIAGGGSSGSSRGAYLEIDGNEHSDTGAVIANLGNVSGSTFLVRNAAGSGAFQVLGSDGTATFTTSHANGGQTFIGSATNGTSMQFFRNTSTFNGEIGNAKVLHSSLSNTDFAIMSANGGQLIIGGNGDPFTNGFAMGANYFRPVGDAGATLGGPSNRWNNEYFVNAPILGSDVRLKKNIIDSPLGLDFINSLRPVSYNWIKDDRKTHFGMIAQEVDMIVPAGSAFVDKTNPDSYGMGYDEFISPVIKAVQELDAKLSNLKVETIASIRDKWSIDANGILIAREVRTDKLCIGATCVDEDTLKTLLQNNGLVAGESTPPPAPEPPPSPEPTPEPQPEPPPAPTPEPPPVEEPAP